MARNILVADLLCGACVTAIMSDAAPKVKARPESSVRQSEVA